MKCSRLPVAVVPGYGMHDVPPPKQATHGLSLNFQVSTTKWATSLRNVSKDKKDPYGVVPVSVVVGHKEKKQARAAESMFSRVISKYDFADSKISDTIHAFTQNVPHPTLDDLGELDRVLSEHVIRTNRKAEAKRKVLTNIVSAAAASASQNPLKMQSNPPTSSLRKSADCQARADGAERGLSDTGRSATKRIKSTRPLGSAKSENSSLYLDVRKDEWYAVLMDQAAKTNEREGREKAEKKKEADHLYATLKVQQKQLDQLWADDLEDQRRQAQQQEVLHKLWEEKETARRAELAEWKKKEKRRADKAKQDVIDAFLSEASRVQEQENQEVRKIKALISQDKEKALQKKAKWAADLEQVKQFNKEEEDRKFRQLREQSAKELKDVKVYQDLLKAREVAREEEEQKRKQKLLAQERVAKARHDKEEGAAEEDERRAAIVQGERQRKEDAKRAKEEAKRLNEKRECGLFIQQQLRELYACDQHQKNVNRREAEVQAKEFEMACIQDEEKGQAARARRVANKVEIQKQIEWMDEFLKDGAGERGMTKFEKQYNSGAIIGARKRRDEKMKSLEKEMTSSDVHRVVAGMMQQHTSG